MIVSDKGGGDFTPPPSGTHIARCVQLVDMGTQRWVFQGKPKATRKARLTFELPEELHVFDEDRGEEPFIVSQEFTASIGVKANLRKALESWRGRPFTKEELDGFELSAIVGAPAMITIVHVTKGDKKYANITGIAKLPKNTKCPKQILPSVNFSLDNFDQKVFDGLPEWLRNKIADSDEYKALENGDMDQTPPPDGEGSYADEDIPF